MDQKKDIPGDPSKCKDNNGPCTPCHDHEETELSMLESKMTARLLVFHT